MKASFLLNRWGFHSAEPQKSAYIHEEGIASDLLDDYCGYLYNDYNYSLG